MVPTGDDAIGVTRAIAKRRKGTFGAALVKSDNSAYDLRIETITGWSRRMLRYALFGTVVIAAAGCASTAGDNGWTARYITRFEPMAKCLYAPSPDDYSVAAQVLRRAGEAGVTLARADQPAVTGDYTIQQVADVATDVTWQSTGGPAAARQSIAAYARAKADRCGNSQGS